VNIRWIRYVLLVTLCGCGSGSGPQGAQANQKRTVSSEELYRRGLALIDQGQLVRAEQYISLAVSRGYPEERAVPVLVKVCLAASRVRSALNYAEPYVVRHPSDWKLRYLIASLYVGLERPTRARQELERVVEIAPSHAPARYLFAVVLRDSFADDTAATEQFQAYLKLDPHGDHAAEVTVWLREHQPSAGQTAAPSWPSNPQTNGELL
jgi:Tfp pilus assembly protein PilF